MYEVFYEHSSKDGKDFYLCQYVSLPETKAEDQAFLKDLEKTGTKLLSPPGKPNSFFALNPVAFDYLLGLSKDTRRGPSDNCVRLESVPGGGKGTTFFLDRGPFMQAMTNIQTGLQEARVEEAERTAYLRDPVGSFRSKHGGPSVESWQSKGFLSEAGYEAYQRAVTNGQVRFLGHGDASPQTEQETMASRKTDYRQPERESRESGTNDTASLEAEARKTWDHDPKLRAEFHDNFAAYVGYSRAERAGLVKVYGGSVKSYQGKDFRAP